MAVAMAIFWNSETKKQDDQSLQLFLIHNNDINVYLHAVHYYSIFGADPTGTCPEEKNKNNTLNIIYSGNRLFSFELLRYM